MNIIAPSIQSVGQSTARHAQLARPLSHGLCTAVIFNKAVIASIICLLFGRGPSAVFWGVVPIAITSFNRMFQRRAWPHIFQEHLKIVPALAHFDAASSVAIISLVFGVIAPSAQRAPHRIFRKLLATILIVQKFIQEASTASSESRLEMVRLNLCNPATRTLTPPFRTLSRRLLNTLGKPQHCQACKDLPGQIRKAASSRDREKLNVRNVNIDDRHGVQTSTLNGVLGSLSVAALSGPSFNYSRI